MNTLSKLSPLALALFAFAAAPLLDGCSTTQPVGTQMSDSEITTKIKTKMAVSSDVSAHNIDVDTDEGTVILHGRVKTQSQKTEAERIARDTNGVKKVINLINVGDMKDDKK